jgi:hypothetical protein
LTFDGLEARDRRVMDWAWQRRMPLAFCMAGGYGVDIEQTVQAQVNTATLIEDAAATPITLTAAGTNYTVLTQPAKGSLAGLPGGAFIGTASGTYTPSANLNGSDSFTFRTIDALEKTERKTYTVTEDTELFLWFLIPSAAFAVISALLMALTPPPRPA